MAKIDLQRLKNLFGATYRFGMFLRSPAGTSVEIIFATQEINVAGAVPEDREDLDLLLSEGIRYATPTPAPRLLG